MNAINLKSLALGVLIGAAALFSIGAAPDRGTVQYEYKFFFQNTREQRYTLEQFEPSVNELAKEGYSRGIPSGIDNITAFSLSGVGGFTR